MITKYAVNMLAGGVVLLASFGVAAEKEEGAQSNRLDLGTAEVHPRMVYINRHFEKADDQEDLGVGGWIRYATPERLGLSGALALAGGQSLGFNEGDRNGIGIVPDDRDNYGVLSEAYLQLAHKKTWVRGHRQVLDTPYLNADDNRMIPITYEAVTAESADFGDLLWMGSYVYGMKPKDSSAFYNMTEAAGYEGGSRPLYLTGFTFSRESAPVLELWEYYFPDYYNIIYGQIQYERAISDNTTLSFALQGTSQQDVGDSLDGSANTGAWGSQVDLLHRGLNLGAGFTQTAANRDMINPWSGYPGYTSLMEEDCNLASEKAWLLVLGYDFSECGLTGLRSFLNATGAWSPEDGTVLHPAQDEVNFTVDYKLPGMLEGLSVRLRAASVNNSLSSDGDDYTDYRMYLNYSCLL